MPRRARTARVEEGLEVFFEAFEHGVGRSARVEHAKSARLAPGTAAIRGAHAAVKSDLLAFDLVESGAASPRDALERGFDGAIEEIRAVGNSRAPAAVKRVDGIFAESAACALVGARRVGIPVAQDVRALGEGWLDQLEEVLPTVGDEEEQLGARLDVLARVEEGMAETLAECRSAGLPGRQNDPAAGREPLCRAVQLGRFPAALDPLERQKKSPGHVV